MKGDNTRIELIPKLLEKNKILQFYNEFEWIYSMIVIKHEKKAILHLCLIFDLFDKALFCFENILFIIVYPRAKEIKWAYDSIYAFGVYNADNILSVL